MNQHKYKPVKMSHNQLISLHDCPKCRYGTMDLRIDKKHNTKSYICADCGAVFAIEEIKGKQQ